MSLFRDSLRPPPVASDEALRRYLEAIRARLEPDPLFRGRLRGVVLNQYVAAREGMGPLQPNRGRAMGRLGRACLYASFTLAMSVGATMAASQAALPGDALYGVKLRVEELRLATLPAEYRDELLAYSLSERITELARLAEAGDWERAAELAGPIGQEYAALADMGVDPGATGLLGARVEALGVLFDRLPEQAQAAVSDVLTSAPGLLHEPGTPAMGQGEDTNDAGTNNASTDKGRGGGAVEPSPSARSSAAPSATPEPTKSPKPSHPPQGSGGPAASPPAPSPAQGFSD